MSNKRSERRRNEARRAESQREAQQSQAGLSPETVAADVVEPADDAAESVDEIVASVEAADEASAAEADGAVGTGATDAGSDAGEQGADGEPEGEDVDEDLDGEDSLTFSNGVIEKIVAIAMRDVPGVIGMKGGWLNRVQDVIGVSDSRKGVTVEVTPDASVRVNISVLIEYGAYAPQVFEDVKKAVVKHVTGMTGLAVAGVNLRIEDVLTSEEVAARRKVEARQEADAEAAIESGDVAPIADAEPADQAGE